MVGLTNRSSSRSVRLRSRAFHLRPIRPGDHRMSHSPALSIRYRGVPLLIVLLLALVAGSCTELLVEPAPSTATLAITVEVPDADPAGAAVLDGGYASVSADPGAAFDRADQVRLRLLSGERTLLSETRSFSPVDGEARLQFEVELENDSESVAIELTLLWQNRALFEAGRSVTLERGETAQVELALAPVPDQIEVADAAVTLDALGAQTQLAATVVFATGDPFPAAAPSWSSTDPSVIQVASNGQVTAVSVGQAAAVASWQGLTAQTTVEVRQVVASVEVNPSTVTLAQGETLQLQAILSDANGNRIVDIPPTVSWSSADPGIVSVDDSGRAEGVSDGTTSITATAEGVSGSTSVTVETAVGTVTGQVLNGATGAVIAGATVDFSGGRATTTNANGEFSLRLPQGTYTATIRADGFSPIEVDDIVVLEDQTTALGRVQIFSDDYDGLFGVWSYLEVVEFPGADTPDLFVFQPPDLFWDVDDLGSCFEVYVANVVVVEIDGDRWTFLDLDDDETFTYRMILDGADTLRAELQDEDFDLTFIFGRTSLTVNDLVPVCSGVEIDGPAAERDRSSFHSPFGSR
ncbi:MAG: hypothetical protein EA351_09955 [Gemmatimonadales bacterium]|nr:MAG: hypothetical protein EA351_09955 [Gemmatimonadales bacterium]